MDLRLLPLFLALALPGRAQLPVVWRAPAASFDTLAIDSITLRVANRSLVADRKVAGGWHTAPLLYYMDPYREFRIEGTVTRMAADPQAEWGVFWGGDETGRGFAIVVKAGRFRVVEFGAAWVELIPWTKFPRLKKAGPHTLGVGRTGGKWTFYIGDKAAATLPARRFFGKRHGFILKGKAEILCEGMSFRRREQAFPEAGGGYPLAVRVQLDSMINTPGHEISPFRAANGRRLFFTRTETLWQEGLAWLSEAGFDSVRWEAPRAFTDAGATGVREAVVSADRNGYFPALLRSKPGRKTLIEWGIADSSERPLFSLPPGLPPGYTDISFSPDHKAVVFSMHSPEGNGGTDLFVCLRDEKGQWSAPRNLGPEVNSFGRDFAPFLLPDGITLFFSSTGRPGYGEADVYVARRLNEAWSAWTTAENLGPVINSGAWNAWYRPFGVKYDRAYMASILPGKQDFDLFYVRVPEDIRSRPVVRLYGQLKDKATGQAISGKVKLRPLDDGFSPVEKETSGPDASYSLYLPYGGLWELLGEQEGYFGVLDTLNLRPVKAYREVRQDAMVSRPEAGLRVQLQRVFFERASPVLLADSYPELERLLALMVALPALEIEIQGHTDNIGKPEELQQLSEARAQAVKQYLLDAGIAARRVTAAGFGAAQPIADNNDPIQRAKNRRVEFVVTRR